MTDHRDPERKLQQDMMRFKRERNEARVALAQGAELVAQLQADLIAATSARRLRRLEDFHLFIGVEKVVGTDGRVDLRKLELQVSDLLRRRPELAAPPGQ